MRKGDLVQFCPQLYVRDSPIHRDKVPTRRPITPRELEDWYQSPASKGMNSAGETKLPPRSVYIDVPVDTIMVVERARCRVDLSYGNKVPGMTKVMLPNGDYTYVRRRELVVVS